MEASNCSTYRAVSKRHKRRLVQQACAGNDAFNVTFLLSQSNDAYLENVDVECQEFLSETYNSEGNSEAEMENEDQDQAEDEDLQLGSNLMENTSIHVNLETTSDQSPEESSTSEIDSSDECETEDESIFQALQNLPEDSFKSDIRQFSVNFMLTHRQIDGMLSVLRKYPCGATLPKDCRTLIKTPRLISLEKLADGEYFHFGLVNGLRKALQRVPVQEREQNLKIKINIDGLNTANSSNNSFWPILAQIANIKSSKPFPVAIYQGPAKPTCPNQYLDKFVSEFNLIKEKNGFRFGEHTYQVEILSFICDLPAKSFVTCTKSHNGYFSCSKCIIEGDYIENRMTFLEHDKVRVKT